MRRLTLNELSNASALRFLDGYLNTDCVYFTCCRMLESIEIRSLAGIYLLKVNNGNITTCEIGYDVVLVSLLLTL